MKRVSREERWQEAREALINRMFEIAGHAVRYEDIKDREDNWFQEWTMTVDEAKQWKSWGAAYLRKRLRLSKAAADREMLWANLQWGLKYSDWSEPINQSKA